MESLKTKDFPGVSTNQGRTEFYDSDNIESDCSSPISENNFTTSNNMNCDVKSTSRVRLPRYFKSHNVFPEISNTTSLNNDVDKVFKIISPKTSPDLQPSSDDSPLSPKSALRTYSNRRKHLNDNSVTESFALPDKPIIPVNNTPPREDYDTIENPGPTIAIQPKLKSHPNGMKYNQRNLNLLKNYDYQPGKVIMVKYDKGDNNNTSRLLPTYCQNIAKNKNISLDEKTILRSDTIRNSPTSSLNFDNNNKDKPELIGAICPEAEKSTSAVVEGRVLRSQNTSIIVEFIEQVDDPRHPLVKDLIDKTGDESVDEEEKEERIEPKRGRGRPRKFPRPQESLSSNSAELLDISNTEIRVQHKRGRPRKNQAVEGAERVQSMECIDLTQEEEENPNFSTRTQGRNQVMDNRTGGKKIRNRSLESIPSQVKNVDRSAKLQSRNSIEVGEFSGNLTHRNNSRQIQRTAETSQLIQNGDHNYVKTRSQLKNTSRHEDYEVRFGSSNSLELGTRLKSLLQQEKPIPIERQSRKISKKSKEAQLTQDGDHNYVLTGSQARSTCGEANSLLRTIPQSRSSLEPSASTRNTPQQQEDPKEVERQSGNIQKEDLSRRSGSRSSCGDADSLARTRSQSRSSLELSNSTRNTPQQPEDPKTVVRQSVNVQKENLSRRSESRSSHGEADNHVRTRSQSSQSRSSLEPSNSTKNTPQQPKDSKDVGRKSRYNALKESARRSPSWSSCGEEADNHVLTRSQSSQSRSSLELTKSARNTPQRKENPKVARRKSAPTQKKNLRTRSQYRQSLEVKSTTNTPLTVEKQEDPIEARRISGIIKKENVRTRSKSLNSLEARSTAKTPLTEEQQHDINSFSKEFENFLSEAIEPNTTENQIKENNDNLEHLERFGTEILEATAVQEEGRKKLGRPKSRKSKWRSRNKSSLRKSARQPLKLDKENAEQKTGSLDVEVTESGLTQNTEKGEHLVKNNSRSRSSSIDPQPVEDTTGIDTQVDVAESVRSTRSQSKKNSEEGQQLENLLEYGGNETEEKISKELELIENDNEDSKSSFPSEDEKDQVLKETKIPTLKIKPKAIQLEDFLSKDKIKVESDWDDDYEDMEDLKSSCSEEEDDYIPYFENGLYNQKKKTLRTSSRNSKYSLRNRSEDLILVDSSNIEGASDEEQVSSELQIDDVEEHKNSIINNRKRLVVLLNTVFIDLHKWKEDFNQGKEVKAEELVKEEPPTPPRLLVNPAFVDKVLKSGEIDDSDEEETKFNPSQEKAPVVQNTERIYDRPLKMGELAWASVSGKKSFFWPCMVTNEPTSGQFTKRTIGIKNRRTYIHVRFFGDRGRRSWVLINNVIPFYGRDDPEYIANYCEGIVDAKLFILPYSTKKLNNWNRGVNEAESLLGKSVEEKLDFFFNEFASVREKKKRAIEQEKEAKAMNKMYKLIKRQTNKRKTVRKIDTENRKKLRIEEEVTTPPPLVEEVDLSFKNPNEIKLNKKRNSLDLRASKRLNGKKRTSIESRKSSNSMESDDSSLKLRSRAFDNYSDDADSKISEGSSTSDQQASLYRRNNIFKGVPKEKACQICKKLGDVVKCKGICNGFYHKKCALDLVDNAEEETKENENNEDDEVDYDKMSLQEKIDFLMREEMKKFENSDYVAPPVVPKVIDMPPVHITAENSVQYSNSNSSVSVVELFKCRWCISEIQAACFICGESENVRQKCSLKTCGKFYHKECLSKWPQTQWCLNSHIEDSFACPSHTCHTCSAEDAETSTRCKDSKLVKCLECPATYHSQTFCVPAGSEILTTTQIICPRHGDEKPSRNMKTVNTNWCFICSEGGKLICCEECPTAVHAECMPVRFNQAEVFYCEDCQSGRLPLYDEIVWVKMGNFRWWPAVVLYPNEIPDNVKAVPHSRGEYAVRFFGTHDYYWIGRGRTFLYQEGDRGNIYRAKNIVDKAFAVAVDEAADAHKLKRDFRLKKFSNRAQTLPHFIKIKTNRPVGKVKPFNSNLSKTTSCICDPNGPYPCANQCLNKSLWIECNSEICASGERCNNHRFNKREYPPLAPYRTQGKGWGLKTLAPLREGQFVIEYVGELINEAEYKRRVKKMHEQKEENYYFLRIDPHRLLDAGPKGNVARFMNHSCEPNCETQKWTVHGDLRVGLFTKKDIPADTELTFNYNLDCIGEEKKVCKCGAPNCSGFIGVKTKTAAEERKQNEKKKYKKKSPIKTTVVNNTDACFICGKIGNVGGCNHKSCNRFYHLTCVGVKEWPKGNKWICPWHNCNFCSKRTTRSCVQCVNSYCPSHAQGNIRYDATICGFICAEHDPTLHPPVNVEPVEEMKTPKQTTIEDDLREIAEKSYNFNNEESCSSDDLPLSFFKTPEKESRKRGRQPKDDSLVKTKARKKSRPDNGELPAVNNNTATDTSSKVVRTTRNSIDSSAFYCKGNDFPVVKKWF